MEPQNPKQSTNFDIEGQPASVTSSPNSSDFATNIKVNAEWLQKRFEDELTLEDNKYGDGPLPIKKKMELCFNKWFFGAFGALAITTTINLSDKYGGELDQTSLPYYVNNSLMGVTLFISSILLHQIFTIIFELPSIWQAALGNGIMFYISRELRDHEKLDYWDYQGLIAPTLCVSYVFFFTSLFTIIFQNRYCKGEFRRRGIWPYMFLFCVFIVAVVMSVQTNIYFGDGFGSRAPH